jgi:hypothetical protein
MTDELPGHVIPTRQASLSRAVNLGIELLTLASAELTPYQRAQLAERMDEVADQIRDSAAL